jgi:hypothetical protein
MTGIDGKRREHRKDALVEVRAEIRPIRLVEIGEGGEDNARCGKFRDKFVEEDRFGTSALDLETLADLTQLGAGGTPIGGAISEPSRDLILQTSDAEAFGSGNVTLMDSGAVALATLVKGHKLLQGRVPAGCLRYLRVVYTIGTAAMTAGKVNAVLTDGVDRSFKVQ